VLTFNLDHSITLFRIHSDTIPFASHPEVDFDWLGYAGDQLDDIGNYLDHHDIRVSMHPGQYTVLNSDDMDVVDNAIRNLHYHTQFLDALGTGPESKIIIHIGGVYGDRENAINRFVKRANNLDQGIRDRLVVENDETSYHIEHLLEIGQRTDLPVVFDWLHHHLNNPVPDRPISEWLQQCFETWQDNDGVPKIHFSSPRHQGNGHHSDRIDSGDFSQFMKETGHLDPFDVMFECKDKELALIELCESLEITPSPTEQPSE
jgi:UV DNA damage endonuclease